MRLYQRPAFWIFVFTVIFMLSLDFWRWAKPISLSLLSFPDWILYFVGLNSLLILAMYSFNRCVSSDMRQEEQ